MCVNLFNKSELEHYNFCSWTNVTCTAYLIDQVAEWRNPQEEIAQDNKPEMRKGTTGGNWPAEEKSGPPPSQTAGLGLEVQKAAGAADAPEEEQGPSRGKELLKKAAAELCFLLLALASVVENLVLTLINAILLIPLSFADVFLNNGERYAEFNGRAMVYHFIGIFDQPMRCLVAMVKNVTEERFRYKDLMLPCIGKNGCGDLGHNDR